MARKAKKEPPPIVKFAQKIGDHGALRRLGRAGAMRKKEIAQIRKNRKIRWFLDDCLQIAIQANEHICPVD